MEISLCVTKGQPANQSNFRDTAFAFNNVKKASLFFLLILGSLASYAQSKRPFYCTAFAAYNKVWLEYKADVPVSSKFPTTEWKLGIGLVKPLGKHFDLRSRIGLGMRSQRTDENAPYKKRELEKSVYSNVYRTAKEITTGKEHYRLEIPIILHYDIGLTNLGIEAGFYTRLPRPSAANSGLLCNLTYTYNRFSVFGGFTMGLGKVVNEQASYKEYYGIDRSDPSDIKIKYHETVYSYSAKTYAIQFGLEFNLFKKLKEE